jgi:hypothetical protein
MRFALMSDEYEYDRVKLEHGAHAVRNFEHTSDRITELPRSDCVQGLDGDFECFFEGARRILAPRVCPCFPAELTLGWLVDSPVTR